MLEGIVNPRSRATRVVHRPATGKAWREAPPPPQPRALRDLGCGQPVVFDGPLLATPNGTSLTAGRGQGPAVAGAAATGRLWPGPADAVGGRDRPSPCPAQRYSQVAVHTGSGMAPDRTGSGSGSGSASAAAARVATMYHIAVSVF